MSAHARAAVGLVADLVDDVVRVPQGAGHGTEELLGGPLVRERGSHPTGCASRPPRTSRRPGRTGRRAPPGRSAPPGRPSPWRSRPPPPSRWPGARRWRPTPRASSVKELLVHVLRVPGQAVGGDAAQLHRLAGGIGELGADDLERAGRGRGGRGRARPPRTGASPAAASAGACRLCLQACPGAASSGSSTTRAFEPPAGAKPPTVAARATPTPAQRHEHRHRDADAREPCPSRRLSHGTLASRASSARSLPGPRGPTRPSSGSPLYTAAGASVTSTHIPKAQATSARRSEVMLARPRSTRLTTA